MATVEYIDNCIEQYRNLRLEDTVKANKIILDAYNLSFECNYNYENARVCYYLAESYFFLNDTDNVIFYAEKAINQLSAFRPSIEKVYAYNLLGACYVYISPLLSLQYYLTALEYCEQSKFENALVSLYGNVGNIFALMENYNLAIEYLLKSLGYNGNSEANAKTLFPLYFNLAQQYYCIDDYNNFTKYYNILKREKDDIMTSPYATCYLILESCNELHYDHFESASILIKDFLTQLETSPFRSDVSDSLIFVIDLLIKRGLYDMAERAIVYLSDNTTNDKFLYFKLQIYGLRIKLYKVTNQTELLHEATEHYYELSLLEKQNEAHAMLSNLNMCMRINKITQKKQQAEQEAKRMKQISELDELTGLYNRHAFNDVFEAKFYSAIQNSRSIAIAIIDIDYFKQFNDTYGHLNGDRCLTTLGDIFRSMQDDKTLFMRFGGDEFLVMYYDQHKEDVYSKACRIKSLIANADIKNDGSMLPEKLVSVTQGLYYGYPVSGQSLNDFIRHADSALYDGKNVRGQIVLDDGTL